MQGNCNDNVQNVLADSDFGDFDTFCPENQDCRGAVNTLFVDFDRILTTTTDATPACMAMYGPNINEAEIENSSDGNYDQCGVLFDFQLDVISSCFI